jgi:cystine transport system ATP-binding protein
LLARALISKKNLLLLENPFEGLESKTIEQIKTAITNIEQTTILVTASANTYQNIFDKIIYLENGTVVSVESKK